MTTRRQEIEKNLKEIRSRIQHSAFRAGRDPNEITLIVVTKDFPITDVEILHDLGERNFGENRDQEGSEKSRALPEDCIWHFQGQIQSKKLRSITSWADVVHSLDDLSHARKISSLGLARMVPVFVQVSLDSLESSAGRGGIQPNGLSHFLSELTHISGLHPVGLMAVAPLGEDAHTAFSRLAAIAERARGEHPQLTSLSCGMSGDFEAAISVGATHIRVGSSILGSR